LEGGGQLDRLHGTPEGAREGTRDQLLEAVLEAVQHTHATLLPCMPTRPG
jgi:hypothetical protein